MENYATATSALRPRRIDLQVRGSAAILTAGLLTAWAIVPSSARAQTPDTAPSPPAARTGVEELRRELDTLKREYEARIAELERRLADTRTGTRDAARAVTCSPGSSGTSAGASRRSQHPSAALPAAGAGRAADALEQGVQP